MAKTGGYFLQGLAGGLQSGMNMGQQLQEMQWKKDQQKKLNDKQQKIADGATMFSNLVKQYGADNIYTDDEIMQLNTAYLSSSYDVQAVIKDTNDAIQSMNKTKLEQDYKWLDLYTDWIDGLDPKDVGGIFETVKGQIQSKQGKQVLEAYTNIYNKKYKAKPTPSEDIWGQAGTLPMELRDEFLRSKGINIPENIVTPTEPKAAGISDYNSAANYLKNYANSKMSDENFNKIRDGIATKFGLDLSGMTRESLRKPEKVIGETEAIKGITAEDVLFDTTGKKLGGEFLFSGLDINALDEAGKVTVGQRWNRIKSIAKITPEEISRVETYLTQQLGIDLNPTLPTPEPAPEPEVKQQGFFSKFNEKVKAYGKNLQEKFSGTQKDYTTMTVDELYELADKQNDAGAYAELKKRGYIK